MMKITSALMQQLLLPTAIFLYFASFAVTVHGQNRLCFAQEGNFTANDTYGATLESLWGTVTTTTSSTLTYGLFNASATRLKDPDEIEAYGVCRGDLTKDACVDCLNASYHLARQLCPIEKQATLFADKCWIRYSQSKIYGEVVTYPYIIWFYAENASNWDNFMLELKNLLDGLRDEASTGGSIRKYAAGNGTVDLYTLYGMVQCSPDLSSQSCSDCLVDITGKIPLGKIGAAVLAPTCFLRFGTTRFFDPIAVSLPSPPPPPVAVTTMQPPPPTQSGKTNSSKTWIIIAVSCSSAVIVVVTIIIVLFTVKRKKRPLEPLRTGDYIDDITEVDSLQFDLDIIREATENFSDSNKLGQGGFGPVFRGKLPSGQEIAVKRLLQNSRQGELEFKNEVLLLVRLQHRNLVRLLGYCFEGVERLLVYEFVPNASLDKFIFDPLKRAILDWDSRYKIILGIARGLLYLHEDSRVRIIHRDLKASNILLDADMNPKVSDFGIARLFEFDQTRGDTSRIAGTYGYMAPEYVMHGHFSLKSDVFSFGVLVLEIMSGRPNHVRPGIEDVEILISQVWMNWREGRIPNIVDPAVKSGYSATIVRCIHIGLLCVQENVAKRPTMTSVVLMLNSQSVTLPIPKKPAFFVNKNSTKDSRSGGNVGGRAGNNTGTASINEASITEPYPR